VREHHFTTRRTARYYTVGGQGDVREIWFVLHGYAQLARYFIRPFDSIADEARLIVAPEALNRYYFETAPGEHARDARVGATWMTREDREHEIEDYVAYLDALAEHMLGGVTAVPEEAAPGASEVARAAPRVVVLGFSQGAQTASRWAARGRTRVHRLILWGAGLAHELTPAPDLFRGASLTIMIGTSDRHIDQDRVTREHERLTTAGVEHELVRYDGEHRIEPAVLREIARAR
jgi:predicted esterase